MANNKKLVNDIVCSTSPAVIIMSELNNASAGFLNELSNWYRHAFWYNSDVDNTNSFALDLAQKVLADDKEAYMKILQLKQFDYEFDIDTVIINFLLDKISTFDNNSIIILDNLELLTSGFNLLELLIKNCPKNLKIVLFSTSLGKINYSMFSPICPKLLDEYSAEMPSIIDFFDEDMTPAQLSTLYYYSKLRHIDVDFLQFRSQEDYVLINEMSIKNPLFITKKGKDRFFVNPNLAQVLLQRYPDIEQSERYNEDINQELYQFYLNNGKEIYALKLAYNLKDVSKINESVRVVLAKGMYLNQFIDFMFGYPDTAFLKNDINKSDFIYANFSTVVKDLIIKSGNENLRNIDKFIQILNSDEPLYYYCHYAKLRIFIKQNRYKDAETMLQSLIGECGQDFDALNSLLVYLPTLIRHSERKVDINQLKVYEERLANMQNSVFYLRGWMSVAEGYLDLGYYKKAIQIIKTLKEWMPYFIVPLESIQYYYYAGDMEYAEKIGLETLDYVKANNITKDTANIYCMLAKVAMYYNRVEDAYKYIDQAVICSDTSAMTKYYSATLKSIIYARAGNPEYGKDLALIYIKLCERYAPSFTYLFYAAYAFCWWSMGHNSEAGFYANKCLAKSPVKSGVWIIASGILVGHVIRTGELKDLNIVKKFLNTCELNALDVVLADIYDCFESIFEFAKKNGMNSAYVEKITALRQSKLKQMCGKTHISVKFFGNTSVSLNGTEIQWKTKKAKELFLYYVLNRERGVDRNAILESLWKDYVYESAINNLKTTNNIIRNTLKNCGIEFGLEYANSKYVLTMKDCDIDVDSFDYYYKRIHEAKLIEERCKLTTALLDVYGAGFALEINDLEFKKLGKQYRQEIVLILLKLVKDLIEDKKYIDAKKYLNALMNIDIDEAYGALADQIEINLRQQYES